ncbi:MAG TPA: thioesterase domain-containing protein [Pseudonocardiaceae bacterium]|nr:thioesterase domain-containing protein [Pseudonocardiaceae bacterium]
MPGRTPTSLDDKRRALLARRLRERRDGGPATVAASDPGVVWLAEGTGTPLFLLPAVGGTAGPYVPLVAALPAGRPVCALESPGLHGAPVADSLDTLAHGYRDIVVDIWPDGPYLLAGWSVGALLAQQIALLLRERRKRVSLLAMFDGVLATPADEPPDDTTLLEWFADDLTATLGAASVDLRDLRGLPERDRTEALIDELEAAGVVPAGIRAELRTRVTVFAANIRAYLAWRPSAVDVPITLLPARETDPAEADRWLPFAPTVSRHPVSGDHHTMFHAPNLAEVAAVLSRCLADADPPT